MRKKYPCPQPRELQPCELPKPPQQQRPVTRAVALGLMASVAALGASVGTQVGPGLWTGR